MKKTFLSIGASVLVLTGCANNLNLGFNKNKINKNENIRDVIIHNNKNHHILADSANKTLFTSYNVGTVGNNLSGNIDVSDILDVRDTLKDYCEAKGGKWIDGKRYKIIANEDTLRAFTTIGKTYKNKYLGECILPNGKGFKVKELGIMDYGVDWQIANAFGGGERVSWHNYYEIDYNKLNPPKKDYLSLDVKRFKKLYPNPTKITTNLKGINNQGKNDFRLAGINNICHSLGGTAYIETDKEGMKKMTLNNYLFKRFDEYYKKYYIQPESLNREFNLFSINKKAYIWCQNTTNPDNQFMLIWQPLVDKFKVIKGYNPSLIPQGNKQNNTQINVNNSINNAIRNNVSNTISKITYHPRIDDKNAYNLAKGVFTIRGDIRVANNPYVKYYGYYIGKIGSCKYASVEKKAAGIDEIYNFKQCNGKIEYTGQTLKGLTQAEYNRFSPYLNGLKQSCETDGEALVQVNGLNLYCRSNKNGGYKIFILNDKFQFLDKIK